MSNKDVLALYGINLTKDIKSGATMILKNHISESRMPRSLFEKLMIAANNSPTQFSELPRISFGVEFEFVGDKSNVGEFDKQMRKLVKESCYCHADRYMHNRGNCWVLGKDGSVDTSSSKLKSPYNFELSTPRLHLNRNKDLLLLKNVVVLIKDVLKGEVNYSCGTHVHIGLSVEDREFNGEDLKNLLTVYSSIESKVFDPLVPKSRRRNRFCKKTEPYLSLKYQKLSTRYCEFSTQGRHNCKKLHLECRQLEGTLDVDTIIAWLLLQSNVIVDILNAVKSNNLPYLNKISTSNAFDLIFKYDLGSDIISMFIDRIIQFKSRTIQAA